MVNRMRLNIPADVSKGSVLSLLSSPYLVDYRELAFATDSS